MPAASFCVMVASIIIPSGGPDADYADGTAQASPPWWRNRLDLDTIDSPSSPSLGGAEFEERVAPCLGDVLLRRVIDADAVPPQEGDGWPPARSEQRPQQARAPERL